MQGAVVVDSQEFGRLQRPRRFGGDAGLADVTRMPGRGTDVRFGASTGRFDRRLVDFSAEHEQVFPTRRELLDPVVVGVGDVDVLGRLVDFDIRGVRDRVRVGDG